jgi:regulator of sigma E protease
MSSILYIVLAILLLSVLIILHELGHFLVGKLFGFGITEFSIGMGPVIFRKKGKETDLTVRAFLIGGACQFYGEDKDLEDGKAFNRKPVWQRFLVVFAGPFMNLLTALVLAFCILLGYGTSNVIGNETFIVVTAVEQESPAQEAGMKEGDILLAVNGTEFSDYDRFKSLFDAVRDEKVDVTVLRNASLAEQETVQGAETIHEIRADGGETIVVHASDIRDIRTGNNRLGVSLSMMYRKVGYTKYNVLTAFTGSFPYCWNMIRQVYAALFDLFTGKACINQMSGVIGTVSIMSESMEAASAFGISDVIYVILALGALISVNFAVVNLVPFPALDGGRIIFIILEILRGKPVPPEKEGLVHFIGMMLLLALIATLMVTDLMNCFKG